jgi:beta-aspartyl-dipeptidase (metallo-type)
MILINECEVYSPDYLGKKDVLVGGKEILAIENKINMPAGLEFETIDGKGFWLVPGLIDAHVHIAGAGGEGGPATRTPAMPLSMMIEAGVTSIVGCLGTDGFSRHPVEVLMKCKALKQQSVSAFMYTGAYQVPVPTILGDVGKDLAQIEEVIGVGEIAISDHRSSFPTISELIKLAAHARVGGMLGNKAGIVNIHMGDAEDPFRPLYEVVEKSELGFRQFFPTHCNRNRHIFEDAIKYGQQGYIDITSSSYPYYPQYEVKPSEAIARWLVAGVPLHHITMTSDACGSLPDFDKDGNLVQLDMGLPKSLLTELNDACNLEKLPLEKVIRIVTSNVADVLKLRSKGRIQSGNDADLILLDKNFHIAYMMAMGKMFISNYQILVKGNYEQ